MAYKSDSIATVVKRLNVQYFLPAIQREFVWDTDQVIQLFDSIMRGYPIGSFLFWSLNPENRDKWEVYKFIDHASDAGTHNELASTDGVPELTLVLDGQQRLTSLLVGLKGNYAVKKKYMRWDNPSAWVKQKLYLNLLKAPGDEEEDGEAGIRYGFTFAETEPDNDSSSHWIKVGRILDFDDEERFYEFCQNESEKLPDTVPKGQVKIFERNLERLYRAMWKDDAIAYYTESDQDYDRALDIFVRANEGGTKLTKSDLLLSTVTAKWGEIHARDEIFGFVDRINTKLTRKNDFDKDFIMKSCLVLSDLPVAYLVKNFNNANLSLIQTNWEQIKSAIERAVDLVNFFGIDRDNLTSANALIPIIYYLYQRPRLSLRGSTTFEVSTAGKMRAWLGAALLNGCFGGASDNILRDTRAVLQKHLGPQDSFPVEEISASIRKSGRTASFDDPAIDNVLELTHGRQLTFLALTLLYDDNGWGTTSCHQDHIFPQDSLGPRKLAAAGYSPDRIAEYLELIHRLGNLELLVPQENQQKLAAPFEKWIKTRDAGFVKRHLIPADSSLWTLSRFPEFVRARERLIRDRLMKLFSVVP